MNNVTLIGRLTRDPEIRYTTGENQTAIAKFSIAIDTGYGDKKRTDFPNIVCFGKTAENCEKWLSKGRQVGISGRIQTGSYEKDGHKVYTTDVIADRVDFIGFNGSQTENDNKPAERGNQAASEGEQVQGFSAITDDELPF